MNLLRPAKEFPDKPDDAIFPRNGRAVPIHSQGFTALDPAGARPGLARIIRRGKLNFRGWRRRASPFAVPLKQGGTARRWSRPNWTD